MLAGVYATDGGHLRGATGHRQHIGVACSITAGRSQRQIEKVDAKLTDGCAAWLNCQSASGKYLRDEFRFKWYQAA